MQTVLTVFAITSQTARSHSRWIGLTPPGAGEARKAMRSMGGWSSLSDMTSPEPQRPGRVARVRRGGRKARMAERRPEWFRPHYSQRWGAGASLEPSLERAD